MTIAAQIFQQRKEMRLLFSRFHTERTWAGFDSGVIDWLAFRWVRGDV